MPTCFVLGCKTRNGKNEAYKENESRSITMFKARKATLGEWSKAIGRTDKSLTTKHFVCELHFKPEDIEDLYIIPLNARELVKIERGRKKLRLGAIPSRFDNWDNVKLHNIKLPSKYWFGGSIVDNKLCFRSYCRKANKNVKRIVIGHDNNVAIYINEIRVTVDSLETIPFKSNENILAILHSVELIIPCSGSGKNTKSNACLGYVCSPGSDKGLIRRCSQCKLHKRNALKRKGSKGLAAKLHDLKGHVKNVVRKNCRLRSKTLLLRHKIQGLKNKCAQRDRQLLEKAISSLPEVQQEAVRCCFTASKVKNT